MITLIKAIPPSFEEGYCPANWREFALKLFSEAQFLFQSDVANSFYNIGDAVPSVDNRAFPWRRKIGGQPDRWYDWSPNYGAWISPYWMPSDAQFALDWTGTETDLKELDNPGGAAVPVTATTGPFWEVDHDFDARIAIGAGTLPVSSTLIGVGSVGGVESITLGEDNLPLHRHLVSIAPDSDANSSLPSETSEAGGFEATGSSGFRFTNAGSTLVGRTREAGVADADQEAIATLPPYRGVLKAKRTGRIYYAV